MLRARTAVPNANGDPPAVWPAAKICPLAANSDCPVTATAHAQQ